MNHPGWMPHGYCFNWDQHVLIAHLLGNMGIALAYYCIPVILLIGVRRRPDIVNPSFGLLFGMFILACGTGHVIKIWTLWSPHYWLAAIWDIVTAVISIATLVALTHAREIFRSLPTASDYARLAAESAQRQRRIEVLLRETGRGK